MIFFGLSKTQKGKRAVQPHLFDTVWTVSKKLKARLDKFLNQNRRTVDRKINEQDEETIWKDIYNVLNYTTVCTHTNIFSPSNLKEEKTFAKASRNNTTGAGGTSQNEINHK